MSFDLWKDSAYISNMLALFPEQRFTSKRKQKKKKIIANFPGAANALRTPAGKMAALGINFGKCAHVHHSDIMRTIPEPL